MSESVNTPDLSGIIGNLLANPAALSGMMNLIGNLRTPQTEEEKNNSNEPTSAENQAKNEENSIPVSAENSNSSLAALAPLLSGASALAPVKAENKNEKSELGFDPMKRRRCLLEAIRPYLSPTRCEHLNLLLRILDVLSLLSLSPKK